jgi:hypothetical protein
VNSSLERDCIDSDRVCQYPRIGDAFVWVVQPSVDVLDREFVSNWKKFNLNYFISF